ncbi:hypothetical protein AMTRI_Chr09g41400 [Amborella trichopoda]
MERRLGLQKEKVSHLHFYFHDVVTAKNPTSITVAQANTTLTSPSASDLINVDDALPKGPKPTSKLIGRAHGFFASASQSEFSFVMAINFVFPEGKFNGSTLTMVGGTR